MLIDLNARQPSPEPEAARILIVDDERIVARDLANTLTDLGYNVVATAATGAAAVHTALEISPDLVLMDIRLSGAMDGIEAAGQIRRERSIPVVFLTAHSDDEILRRAQHTEPMGYLIKPFRTPDLRCTVEVALHRHAAETARMQRAEAEALVDPLTGLWNRRAWDKFRAVEDSRCRRRQHNACVISVDLDGLKIANDTLGHTGGDDLLRRASSALKAGVREQDYVARVGGDEFAILLVECSDEMGRAVEKRLRLRLDEEQVEASIGFANRHAVAGLDGAWEQADEEMYRQKRSRKARRSA